MSNIQRSKADEQLETALENFLKNWRLSLPVTGAVILAVSIWQKDKILPYIPVEEIAETAELWINRLFIFLLIMIALFFIRSFLVRKWNRRRFSYLQILPHTDDGVKPETLGEMIRRFHGTKRKPLERLFLGKEWFTFIVHYRKHETKGNQYIFYLGADESKLQSLKRHVSSLYSRAEFFEAEDIRFPGKKAVGGRMTMKRKKLEATLSLARYRMDQLPGVLNVMEPGTWLQVNFSANDGWKLKRRIMKAEKEIKNDKSYRERSAFDAEEMKSYHSRFAGSEVAFDVLVSFASEYERGVPVIKDMGNAVGSMMADVNELRFKKWRHSVHYYPQKYPYRMIWTGSELANLIHLPHFKQSGLIEKLSEEIPHGSKGSQLLPKNILSNPEGYPFGTLRHPLVDNRDVRVLPQALTKHWGLTGKNGSGKSTLLNRIFKSFTEEFLSKEKAPGFSFMDPAKETAVIILNQLLKAESEGRTVNWDKVHWISFKGASHPPAMNLLHQINGETDAFVTDQIMRIIRENNFSVAPQAERLMKKCIQTLIADKGQKHTILGVRPLLLRPKYLRSVLARIEQDPKNQDLVGFWIDEAPDLIDTSKNAILNRLDIFYSNDFLRRMFGQSSFNFPIREWMDEGHIVFYDFSGMSAEEIGLVGGYLSYLYYRLADTRPDKSLLHQFCIDEAQRVKASIFPEIIAEMRKKGLSLGVSTQTLSKLDSELQKALIEITGNMFVCGQGKDGAKLAADVFKITDSSGKSTNVFSEGFLMNLPVRTAAIKTEDTVDGMEKVVHAVIDVPPLDRYKSDGTVANFHDANEIAASNAWTMAKAKELESRNGLSITDIDRSIQRYLNNEAPKEDLEETFMEDISSPESEISLDKGRAEEVSTKEGDPIWFDVFADDSDGRKDRDEKKELEKEWSFMDE